MPILSIYLNLLCFCCTEICPIRGQVKKHCAGDPSCQTTCVNRFGAVACLETCSFTTINGISQAVSDRCACPDGMIIDEDKNECVLPSDCTPGNNGLFVFSYLQFVT